MNVDTLVQVVLCFCEVVYQGLEFGPLVPIKENGTATAYNDTTPFFSPNQHLCEGNLNTASPALLAGIRS